MRRSQSVRRAVNALLVLAIFMIVLRLLKPESEEAVIKYDDVRDVHAGSDPAHAGHNEEVRQDIKPAADLLAAPEAAPAVEGPPFDAEAAYKEIVYGAPSTPVVIFSKSYCPHSKRAKQLLLEDHLIQPKPRVVELDLHNNGADLQNYIAELTGRRTVPNILVNGITRGGASEMAELGDQLAAKLIEWGSGQITVEAQKAHIQPEVI